MGWGLGDTGAGVQGNGVADPAAPAWHPGCGDSGEAGCIVLAVSGAGVPLGPTLCCGVYGLAFGIVAPEADGLCVAAVPVAGAVAPAAAVPLVVVPPVVVVVVVPVVVPEVCAHAAPPARAVSATAKMTFFRSYLMARVPERFREKTFEHARRSGN